MAHEPYREFRAEELILRDFLALDRTVLANQRTFLAYIRTSLAFLVTGAGFIKFFGGGLVLGHRMALHHRRGRHIHHRPQ